MKSPNTSNLNKGFTLVEIVVVIGILSVLLGLGLLMSMDSYRGYLFRSEQSVIVSLLQKARSRSLANLNQVPWSLCYDTTPAYTLFRGRVFSAGASTNEPVPARSGVTVTGLPLCSSGVGITFSQLAATTTPATITITENGKTSTISINYAGTILW